MKRLIQKLNQNVSISECSVDFNSTNKENTLTSKPDLNINGNQSVNAAPLQHHEPSMEMRQVCEFAIMAQQEQRLEHTGEYLSNEEFDQSQDDPNGVDPNQQYMMDSNGNIQLAFDEGQNDSQIEGQSESQIEGEEVFDLNEDELEARGLKKIQIEGEEDEFLMDNEGNIYDLAGNFIGTTNEDGEEEGSQLYDDEAQ